MANHHHSFNLIGVYMFIRKTQYEKFLQKVKVEVGTLVGCDTDAEAYLVLKELDTESMLKLRDASGKGEEEVMAFFKKILPNIIVEHNFYEDESTKMKNSDVVELVFEKMELTSKILQEYSDKAFRHS